MRNTFRHTTQQHWKANQKKKRKKKKSGAMSKGRIQPQARQKYHEVPK